MKNKRTYIVLGLILAIGAFLRLNNIALIPPSLSWDEVSIGYNAYSILKTGKDEHGRFLPLDTFVAYGDYKPPLTVYLTVPSVALFGLTEFAVRLPSAIAGVATILATYLLVSELFGGAVGLSLIAAGILAISPWHTQLSRVGFEANIATFFLAFGAWLVLYARKHSRVWFVCFLPFAAAVYTFNSARYFGPLLVLGLTVYSWQALRKNLRSALIGAIIAAVCLIPILPHLVSREARLRFAEVNIFSDISIVETANRRQADDQGSFLGKVFDNRRIGYARSFLSHYLDNLEPWFLFVRGDGNPKFSLQDVGELYIIELPFFLLGWYFLFLKHRSTGWLLLFWLLGAMIPAGVARETPHALRIENSLPIWQIVIAVGIAWAVDRKKSMWRWLVSSGILLLYAVSMAYYLHNYYIHYPREFSREWQFGYREAIAYAESVKQQYRSIVMTDSIGRPYMYTLFYTKADPEKYRRAVTSGFDAAGFYDVSGFGKYRFFRGSVGTHDTHTLYIVDPGSVPEGARKLKTIYLMDGKPALEIFDL